MVAEIHAEAQALDWHRLTPQQKGPIYAEWAERFDLKHSALKDGVMKGFDAAQHVPRRARRLSIKTCGLP